MESGVPKSILDAMSGGETKGLFQSKRSSQLNVLTNPMVKEHLMALHNAAKEHSIAEEDVTSTRITERERVESKINAYNRRVQLEAFKIKIKEKGTTEHDVSFEGAIRFYFEEGNKKLVKAVRLTNTTTIQELLPILNEKFNIENNQDWALQKKAVYQIIDGDEIRLDVDDKPLDLAVAARTTPRYVLRVLPNNRTLRPTPTMETVDSSDINIEINDRPPAEEVSNRNNAMTRVASENVLDHSGAFTDLRIHHSLSQPSLKYMAANGPDLTYGLTENFGLLDSGSENRESEVENENNENHTYAEPSSVKTENGSPSKMEASPSPGPAALLISTRRRKKREQSMDRERSRERGRSPSRERARRSMKAAKNLFQRTFSLRKRDDNNLKQSELSFEETSPGVLKIFGDSISPGANYKSVLASNRSTGHELVKEALERYGLPKSRASEYVLCDVIGKLTDVSIVDDNEENGPEENIWTTECVRVVGSNERPLVLQSLWKPREGYSRRFEIRCRSDIINSDEEDTITHAINENARKMEMARTCPEAIPVLDLKGGLTRAKSDESIHTQPRHSYAMACGGETKQRGQREGRKRESRSRPKEKSYTINSRKAAFDSRTDVSSTDDQNENAFGLKIPTTCPYFLTLRGYNPKEDCLAYSLHEQVIMIGNDESIPKKKGRINLTAPDLLSQHCWVIRNSTAGQLGTVSLDPLADSKVTVNNSIVLAITDLKPGDLVGFGDYYVFLFKDPTVSQEIGRDLPWLNIQPVPPIASPSKRKDSDSLSSNSDQEKQATGTSPRKVQTVEEYLQRKRIKEYRKDNTKLKLPFDKEKQDVLLSRIISLPENNPSAYPLCPSYLFIMAIEYYAVKYDKQTTRSLLQRITSLIQTAAWNKTKHLASSHTESAEPINPRRAVTDLFPDLTPIIYWMSNSLELLSFLRTQLCNYVMDPADKLQPRTRVHPEKVDEETLSLLEEIVMYTFQQAVYYLTKTLYVALSAVLECNPFHSEDNNQEDQPSVQTIIEIFQNTLDMLKKHLLHPHIISQLFCYLFFFANASLMNSVIEKGRKGQYYQWLHGAQIRGNIDLIDAWCEKNNLQEEASTYLRKINMAADLLAMPKIQLLLSDWYTLRKIFNALSPAQLHHLLSHYQVGDKQRPEDWVPLPKEADAASKEDDLLESFNNHPPLTLPKGQGTIDLHSVPDQSLLDVWREMEAEFKPAERDYDSDDSGVEGSPLIYLQHLAESSNPVIYHYTDGSLPTDTNSATSYENVDGSGRRDVSSEEGPFTRRDVTLGVASQTYDGGSSSSEADEKVQKRHRRRSVGDKTKHNAESLKATSVEPLPNSQRTQTRGLFGTDSPSDSFDSNDCRVKLIRRRSSVKQELYQRDSNEALNAAIRKCHENVATGDYIAKSQRGTVPSSSNLLQFRRISASENASQLSESWPLRRTSDEADTFGALLPDHQYPSGQLAPRGLAARALAAQNAGNVLSSSQSLSTSQSETESKPPPRPTRKKVYSRTSSNPLPVQYNYPPSAPIIEDQPLPTHTSAFQLTPSPLTASEMKARPSKPPRGNSSIPRSGSTTDTDSRYPHRFLVKRPPQGNKRPDQQSSTNSVPAPPRPPPPNEYEGYYDVPKSCKLKVGQADKLTSVQGPFAQGPRQEGADEEHVIEVSATETLCKSQSSLTVLPLTAEEGGGKSGLANRASGHLMTGGGKDVNSMERMIHNVSKSDGTVSASISETITVNLVRNDKGLGLGLIDGMYTPLQCPGIYVRTLVAGGPAVEEGSLDVGDRILAVNGTSIVGADYQSAMLLIRSSGDHLAFLVAKGNSNIAMKIATSTC